MFWTLTTCPISSPTTLPPKHYTANLDPSVSTENTQNFSYLKTFVLQALRKNGYFLASKSHVKRHLLRNVFPNYPM